MKKLTLLLAVIMIATLSWSHTDTTINIYIGNDSVIVSVQPDSDTTVIPVFSDTNIDNIVNKYVFRKFEKLVPKSRFPDTRQLYEVICDNTAVATELEASFPVYCTTPVAVRLMYVTMLRVSTFIKQSPAPQGTQVRWL